MIELPDPDDPEEVQRELAAIAARLADRFTGTFTPATVQRYVFESYRKPAESSRLEVTKRSGNRVVVRSAGTRPAAELNCTSSRPCVGCGSPLRRRRLTPHP
jgi:hypothetical protein